MFGRRNPLAWHGHLRSLVWPRTGWSRLALYIKHRLGRLPGTPYRIAAGFACGAAISFTPFIGLHFALAALTALLIRGNIVASAIGTAVGNPWTFPLIWYWIYVSGQAVLGHHDFLALPDELSFAYIFDNPMEVLLPMTVGGIPTSLAVWLVTYFIMHRLVSGYQKARRVRRVRKRLRDRAASRKQAEDLSPQEAQVESGDKRDDAVLAARGQH